ncbi:hypothetical protein [Bradyrhizobium sp. LB11.1]|uniref:hypothetical protein n=1 Tax=Bradyrhizobium sp. LB11.1 TaxID=3156326 RepID=UPI003397A67A
MFLRLRALRALTLSKDAGSQDASPLLIRIAVVLALLLAMLDVDRHSARLRSLGLMCDTYSADPISVPAWGLKRDAVPSNGTSPWFRYFCFAPLCCNGNHKRGSP